MFEDDRVLMFMVFMPIQLQILDDFVVLDTKYVGLGTQSKIGLSPD